MNYNWYPYDPDRVPSQAQIEQAQIEQAKRHAKVRRIPRNRKTWVGNALTNGSWFMWNLGEQLRAEITVWRGAVHDRHILEQITRQQALALIRWHYEPGIYYSYVDYGGKWHDVRVCGDIDAWYGHEWLLIQKHKKEIED